MYRNGAIGRWRRFMPLVLCCCVGILFCMVEAEPSSAATGDDLAKTANNLLRTSERHMFKGENEKADELLTEAVASIDKLTSVAPDHRRLKSLNNKYTKLRKQIDKKLGKSTGKSYSAAPKLPSKPKVKPISKKVTSSTGLVSAEKQSGGAKLPGGVKKRIRDISKHLDGAERYAATDAKNAKYKLQRAQELFAEIDKMYAGQFDKSHKDYMAVKSRYDSLMGQADTQGAAEAKALGDAQAAKDQKEKQSADWVSKFRVYLSYSGQEGHNPAKVVFVPGTSEPEKFAEAKRRYQEFKAFYETYKTTAFPYGKTWQLEDLADNQAPKRLADFESSFADRMASVSGGAEQQIDRAMGQLEKDNGWKSDTSIRPPLVDSKQMASIAQSVESAVSALGDTQEAKTIRDKYAALVAKDQANRKIRAERTLLFPDIYKGSDSRSLKKKAETIVAKEKPGSKILRVSLYKDEWSEETVEEWTDTTRSAVRKRTTRKINAQVAAKDSSGVFMHTLHIAKDKQSGGWSKLYGNIMWSDPMLKSNVKKDGKRK